jgi:hypothetical protein
VLGDAGRGPVQPLVGVDNHCRDLAAGGHLRYGRGFQIGHEVAGGRGQPEEYVHGAVVADRDPVDEAHVDQPHRPPGRDAAGVLHAVQRGQDFVTQRILR